jgi:S-adenosylmethionine/arginine decarboxylase-like enzyme
MAAMEPELGARMHSLGVVLRGNLPDGRWIEFLQEVAKAIDMTAVDEPKVWTYPTDGKGGTGQTIVLPITESFIVLDTWRDHSGAYLFVCSCRSYYDDHVDVVANAFGLKAAPQDGAGRFYAELNLK